jgi:hypothetical protein
METNKTFTFCGSIIKKESLIPINSHILEHTWVAEANFPYANYYGHVPVKPKPNSLFLFTDWFYSLEEVLWMANGFDACYAGDDLNVASAVVEFQNKQYPAIRVKNFPDYEQLKNLQECLLQQGIIFSKKTPLVIETKATINKCFKVREVEEGIYIDVKEDHKGYIVSKSKINRKNFEELFLKIRNNSVCPFYDAVPGGFIIGSRSVDIIRVFSEKLDIELLKCIRKEISKFI